MFKHARFFLHLGETTWMRREMLTSDALPLGFLHPETTVRVEKSPPPALPVPANLPSGTAAGMVNGHCFLQSACIRLPSENMRKGKNGFHAEIVCDGHARHLQSMNIAIGVGHYADDRPIAEADGVDHERLFFSSRPPAGRPRPTGCAGIVVTQARRIQVITDEPMTVFLDGYAATRTPATFTFFRRP